MTVVLLLAVVLLLSSHMSHGQHWSYGLRPGGKREVESLQESYAEVRIIQIKECMTNKLVSFYGVDNSQRVATKGHQKAL